MQRSREDRLTKFRYITLHKIKAIRPTWSIEKMQNIEVLTLNMWIWNTYVVELKDGNRATIIDVRGKNEYFAEVVNAYGQTVAKRNIIDEEIK